jgi:FkbM family methyltransferase
MLELKLADPKDIFILGRNKFAVSAAMFIDFSGYIDDFSNETHFMGKKIVKMSELDAESFVINASTMFPVKVSKTISNYTQKQIHVFEFLEKHSKESRDHGYWAEFRKDFIDHQYDYARFEKSLSDQTSINIWNCIKHLRMTGEFLDVSIYPKTCGTHYFPDFLDFGVNNHVFFDVGSFDGETSLDFIQAFNDYKKIYAFEPNPKNHELLHIKLNSNRDIEIVKKGISSRNEYAGFSTGLGSASHFDSKSDLKIELVTIDSLNLEPPTFIKMDIEGMERYALEGGRVTISKWRPILAISIYHLFDDVRVLFDQITTLLPNSNFYLRHFSEGIDETVLFCVPN